MLYIYIYIQIKYMYTYRYTYTCTFMYIYICLCICLCIGTCTCMYMYMYSIKRADGSSLCFLCLDSLHCRPSASGSPRFLRRPLDGWPRQRAISEVFWIYRVDLSLQNSGDKASLYLDVCTDDTWSIWESSSIFAELRSHILTTSSQDNHQKGSYEQLQRVARRLTWIDVEDLEHLIPSFPLRMLYRLAQLHCDWHNWW